MNDIADKRRFPRLDSSHLISFTHFDESDTPDDVGMGKTLDLSEGGVMIQTHRPFPINTGLEMVIALEERMITVRGRVVHVRQVEEDLYDVGVCFTEIDDAEKKSLMQFFRKIAAV